MSNLPPPKPKSWQSGDGREQGCLDFVRSRAGARGDPQAVLDAIDQYGRGVKWLMNVGKGSHLVSYVHLDLLYESNVPIPNVYHLPHILIDRRRRQGKDTAGCGGRQATDDRPRDRRIRGIQVCTVYADKINAFYCNTCMIDAF